MYACLSLQNQLTSFTQAAASPPAEAAMAVVEEKEGEEGRRAGASAGLADARQAAARMEEVEKGEARTMLCVE